MRPTGKDRKIMERDLGGLYAVGVFRLNKVGGFILGSYGDKKHFDVEYRVEKSQFSISSDVCFKRTYQNALSQLSLIHI